MIEIVNTKTYSGDDATYVGRPSPLGNPYTHLSGTKYGEHKVETRDEAVESYREWLQNALKHDRLVYDAFWHLVSFYRDFGKLVLSCHCAPKRCHAEILRDMILEVASEN